MNQVLHLVFIFHTFDADVTAKPVDLEQCDRSIDARSVRRLRYAYGSIEH